MIKPRSTVSWVAFTSTRMKAWGEWLKVLLCLWTELTARHKAVLPKGERRKTNIKRRLIVVIPFYLANRIFTDKPKRQEGRQKDLLCLSLYAVIFPAWVLWGDTTTGARWGKHHNVKVCLAYLCSCQFFFSPLPNSLYPLLELFFLAQFSLSYASAFPCPHCPKDPLPWLASVFLNFLQFELTRWKCTLRTGWEASDGNAWCPDLGEWLGAAGKRWFSVPVSACVWKCLHILWFHYIGQILTSNQHSCVVLVASGLPRNSVFSSSTGQFVVPVVNL